jgi:carbamoyltransferase
MELYRRLYHLRSDVPAITHIDYSARIQSVNKKTNPRYWTLINEFKKLTGYGVIVNTSFNVRGEPIVCTPDDAFRCFMRTEMDYLVMGNYLFDKQNQEKLINDINWKEEFKLD